MNDYAPAESAVPREVLCFGDFRLDLAARELRRAGEEIAIAPKTLACLAYLLSQRERAVGREELVEHIWGHAHISEGALSQTVLQLRKLLGDGDGSRYIKSIRGYGYRWIAPTWAEPAHAAPSEAHAPEPVPPFRPGHGGAGGSESASDLPETCAPVELPSQAVRSPSRIWKLMGGLHLLLLAGLLALVLPRDPAAPPAREDVGPVLVLPLDVEPEEPGWLRLGGMDLLASQLRASGLEVVPVETVLQLLSATAELPPDQRWRRLAEATGSTRLLQARVQRVEHRWSVRIEAVDPHALPSAGPSAAPLPVRAEASEPLEALRGVLPPLTRELGQGTLPDPEGDASLQRLRAQVQAAVLEQQYEQALQRIEWAPPALRDHPEVLYAEASLHFRRGELERARGLFEQLSQQPDPQTPLLRLRARAGLAVTLAALDARESARELMLSLVQDPAIELDPRLAGNLHLNLAVLAATEGRRAEASEALSRASQLLTGSGDIQALARLDLARGAFDTQDERPAEAAQRLQRAVAGFDAIGDRRGALRSRAALLNAQLALLDLAAASETAAALTAQSLPAELEMEAAEVGFAMAQFQRARGHSTAAAHLLQRVLGGLAGRAPNVQRYHLSAQALLLRWQLEDDATAELAGTAEALLAVEALRTDAQLRGTAASVWLSQVRAHVRAGQLDAATRAVDAFSAWSGRADTAAARAYLALAEAELARAADREGVDRYYGEALQYASSPRLLLEVLQSQVDWLLQREDGAEAALALVDRLGVHADRHFEAALLRARVLGQLGPVESWRAALGVAETLAGERALPPQLRVPPGS